MSRRSALVAGLALSAALAGALVVVAALPPAAVRIEMRIHYSHFTPDAVTVPHGVPVTFVLVNEDPIDHEWLIGDDAFHARHRTGTEPVHGDRPNEVSLPGFATRETTLTFAAPTTLLYVCHFPGHEAYGMVGTLTIT